MQISFERLGVDSAQVAIVEAFRKELSSCDLDEQLRTGGEPGLACNLTVVRWLRASKWVRPLHIYAITSVGHQKYMRPCRHHTLTS